jgi:hypothetical protein
MARYFSLLTKQPDGQWTPQFGDYDEATVKDEYLDYKNCVGRNWPPGTKFKIIATKNSTQAAINAAVAALNNT